MVFSSFSLFDLMEKLFSLLCGSHCSDLHFWGLESTKTTKRFVCVGHYKPGMVQATRARPRGTPASHLPILTLFSSFHDQETIMELLPLEQKFFSLQGGMEKGLLTILIFWIVTHCCLKSQKSSLKAVLIHPNFLVRNFI